MSSTTPRFTTVHILNSLPLHNMNRDQNGLPKSEMDGGVQRARISSQALKRAARVAFRDAGYGQAVRTRLAIDECLTIATAYAADKGVPLDEKKAKKAISSVITALTKDTKATKAGDDADDKDPESSDNVIFLANAEIATLAHAVVDAQAAATDEPSGTDAIVADATSPALEIAAFGRMFANDASKGTHAGIAVSHAHTTHPMQLTADYFTAAEDLAQDHAGAAHIGVAYYTSGVYYRSFTIDINQLRRSWSTIDAEGSRDAFAQLVRCLITALPSGRGTNSNPYTPPILVLAETQQSRTAYAFDTPVTPEGDGGYSEPSIRALADQRRTAVEFDPQNYPAAVGYTHNNTPLPDADMVTALDDIVTFITEQVYA